MWLLRAIGLGIVIGVLCGCHSQAATEASAQPNSELLEAMAQCTFRGEPIQPFFLTEFCGGAQADEFWTEGMGQRVTAISVPGLCNSRGSYAGAVIHRGEYTSFALGNDGRVTTEFGYRFCGTTPGGITVLEYFGNTGGSGTALGLLFVRFEIRTLGTTGTGMKDVLTMRFVGEERWGDRVRRSVRLDGNRLLLGPTQTDIPGHKSDPGCSIVLE